MPRPRRALKEFLQHSKESREVLGQASRQAKGRSFQGKEGSFHGKGGRKPLREIKSELKRVLKRELKRKLKWSICKQAGRQVGN